MIDSGSMTPFLKWAGGKRWFVNKHRELLNIEYNNYFEPFLGSGAVFFKLCPESAILSDANIDLIDTYKAIKTDWRKVEALLLRHHHLHSKDYYYKVRQSKPRTLFTRAAKFIYLNRTCWNGLYRVNKQGGFNVPIGTKTKVVLESDDFCKIARQLEGVELISVDFESTINKAQRDDLIFVDPPYTVKHNNNGFIKYNESIFSWSDQVRLSNSLKRAKNRGVKIILTNAYHKTVETLYEDAFQCMPTERHSVLAAAASNRKVCKELVITNIPTYRGK